MNPRLVAVSGPAEGQVFLLRRERFTVGRTADCDLQLASLEVSRRHCELRRCADGRFTLVDLQSRHGVFVNSRPVRERTLAHSDLVTIGGSVFLFLLDETSDSGSAAAAGAASSGSGRGPSFGAGSTLARKPTDLLYLDAARVDAALPAQARIARDLHVLLRVSASLHGPRPLEQLGERLLNAVFEVTPAERAAVMLREPGIEELTSLAARSSDGGDSEIQAGRALVEQVMGERSGLLVQAPPAHDQAKTSGATSLLATPLLDSGGEILGVVCAESRMPDSFDEQHLEMLGAVAGIASMAFQNALHLRWIERENRRLRKHQLEHDMVGESEPMRRLLDLVARVARAETTVLILGESGTGKELAAQAIHRSSARAERPFVAINCATLSPTLLESELFGHEKGAFTGAVERKIGKLEAAAGGSLFLDEVGELPPELQARLLRVLQEREFERVGGTRPMRADLRILAATNRDLEAMVRQGSFRQDLYYRLQVIRLEAPPLRRRRDDIPLLTSHFLAHHGRRLGRYQVTVSTAARRCLMAYGWPGNVRELGNVIERALVLGDSDVIGPEDLPPEVLEGAADAVGELQAALIETKKKLILRAYREAGGDYTAAAGVLGVHVNSLHRMIARLELKAQLEG